MCGGNTQVIAGTLVSDGDLVIVKQWNNQKFCGYLYHLNSPMAKIFRYDFILTVQDRSGKIGYFDSLRHEGKPFKEKHTKHIEVIIKKK